jgi:hypothetical protein
MDMPLGAWFSEMRSWLDKNRFDPSVFAFVGRQAGRAVFHCSFANLDQARLFGTNFPKYFASIRDNTALEARYLTEDSNDRLVGGKQQ